MSEFNHFIFPYFKNFALVRLEDSDIRKVEEFVPRLIEKKLSESHHRIDSNMEYKRWVNGILGECAVEKYIRRTFIDWSIGDSKKYHVSDLSKLGIKCGIKTVQAGKLPIIFKRAKEPEIIVIQESLYNYYICGVATEKVLNKYQSDEFVKSGRLRSRGTKTAFYGFEHLISPVKLKERFKNEIHS